MRGLSAFSLSEMMKRTLLLTLSALIIFTSCSKAASKQGNAKGNFVASIITPDEKVKEIMGDSIADIIFSPKVTVVAYKMSPSEKPGDNDPTIGGVKIAEQIGKIDKCYFPIMQFFLSDSTTYSGEAIVPARPFIARTALEFKLKKESVFLLFSFGSGEVAAVTKGKEIWHHHIGDMHKFILFFAKIRKDKDIEFYLNK